MIIKRINNFENDVAFPSQNSFLLQKHVLIFINYISNFSPEHVKKAFDFHGVPLLRRGKYSAEHSFSDKFKKKNKTVKVEGLQRLIYWEQNALHAPWMNNKF